VTIIEAEVPTRSLASFGHLHGMFRKYVIRVRMRENAKQVADVVDATNSFTIARNEECFDNVFLLRTCDLPRQHLFILP